MEIETKCPYFNSCYSSRSKSGEESLTIVCGITHRPFEEYRQAKNVIERFCTGDFEHCNYYKKQEEIKMDGNTFITNSDGKIEITLLTNAQLTHQRICEAGKAAVSSIAEMGKNLKIMRDNPEYYKALGFSSFAEYVENNKDYSFKERQAYSYIKIFEDIPNDFLQLNANVGVTKLELLTKLNQEQLTEVSEENDLCGMSVAEIKQLVKDKQGLGEQLSFMTSEVERLKDMVEDSEKDELLEQLKASKNELETSLKIAQKDKAAIRERLNDAIDKITELSEKVEEPATVEPEPRELTPEEIEEIRKTYKEEAEQKYQESLETEKRKMMSMLNEKEKQAKARIAELAKQASERDAQAKVEKEKLEKQLKGSSDEVKIALKFYFGEVQKNVSSFLEKLSAIEDEATKQKFTGGTVKWLEMIVDNLKNDGE